MFARRGADVGCTDQCAEPPRRGDRLQSGDANAHHEHPCRADRAGGGHHHRKGAAIGLRGVDHRLVARQVRLRRQYVHRLGAGDARHQLHRHRRQPRGGIGVDGLAPPERRQDRDEHRARLDAGQAPDVGPLHAEDQVAAGDRGGARVDRRAGLGKGAVRDIGPVAGTGLDGDGRTQGDQFPHRLRRRSDAPLGFGRLAQNGDPHQFTPNRVIRAVIISAPRTVPSRSAARQAPRPKP